MAIRRGYWILGILSLVVVLAVCLLPPLAQDPAYHAFADRRGVLGIPNGLNALSNLAFALVGGIGLWRVFAMRHNASGAFVQGIEIWPYALFFASIALVAPGSAYYHFAPDNARLIWDRLPMAVSFAALVAMLVCDRISPRAGLYALIPLMLAGIGSVLYWRLSAGLGRENLWPYAAVQFYSLALVVLLARWFPARYSHTGYFALALALYVAAKLAEHFDAAVLAASALLSGHTLKHLLAAAAVFCIVRMLALRRPLCRHDAPKSI